MSQERRDFDKEAVSWDTAGRVKLAKEVADAIKEQFVLTAEQDVLDFGCGTGLLTLQLQPFVRSIKGVDSSPGMLDILKEKVNGQGLSNVSTQCRDIEKGDVLEGGFHLIVSSMTLHHIKESKPLIAQFYSVTASNGCLCIADLDLDNGQFHGGNDEGVFHSGFDRTLLRQTFAEAGFTDIWDGTAATVIKPVADGEERQFSIFLMTGCKRS